jgi:hypothetical protein
MKLSINGSPLTGYRWRPRGLQCNLKPYAMVVENIIH